MSYFAREPFKSTSDSTLDWSGAVPNSFGKHTRGDIYFHSALFGNLSSAVRERIHLACSVAEISHSRDFNVVKLRRRAEKISFLNYHDFFNDPFPKLRESWSVGLTAETVRHVIYAPSNNPPILHRKELLLPPNDPFRKHFERLTEQLERAGLFAQSQAIGFQRQWCDRLHEAGYRVEDHRLVPLRVSPDRDHGAG